VRNGIHSTGDCGVFSQSVQFEVGQLARLLLFLAQWDGTKLWLVIDRTHWEFGDTNHNLLVVSATLGDTAIPLIWKALDKDGASNAAEGIELMKRLLVFMPAVSIACVLADREFIGETWMAWLQEQNIPFIVRLKRNMRALLANDNRITLAKLCAGVRTGAYGNRHNVMIGKGLRVGVQGKRTGKGLVVVAFSGDLPEGQPVNLYRRRWRIECGFACLKRKGFAIEDTHLIHPERLETLMAVVAIAFAWALAIGGIAPKPTMKNHGYPTNCLFTLGKHTLIHALNFTEKIANLIAYAFTISKSNFAVV
jgi:hypothetical protein